MGASMLFPRFETVSSGCLQTESADCRRAPGDLNVAAILAWRFELGKEYFQKTDLEQLFARGTDLQAAFEELHVEATSSKTKMTKFHKINHWTHYICEFGATTPALAWREAISNVHRESTNELRQTPADMTLLGLQHDPVNKLVCDSSIEHSNTKVFSRIYNKTSDAWLHSGHFIRVQYNPPTRPAEVVAEIVQLLKQIHSHGFSHSIVEIRLSR
eukprot:c9989_g1_i1.p1 GENE.c9989_g1_i1~~c9989_g1_i1.p1  ORF type:complete len:215 (+),score=23.06 c9989_g1_i1:675-1319(+)